MKADFQIGYERQGNHTIAEKTRRMIEYIAQLNTLDSIELLNLIVVSKDFDGNLRRVYGVYNTLGSDGLADLVEENPYLAKFPSNIAVLYVSIRRDFVKSHVLYRSNTEWMQELAQHFLRLKENT